MEVPEQRAFSFPGEVLPLSYLSALFRYQMKLSQSTQVLKLTVRKEGGKEKEEEWGRREEIRAGLFLKVTGSVCWPSCLPVLLLLFSSAIINHPGLHWAPS